MGRPTKLTPEVQKKIVDAIRAGNYKEVAARYAGIGETTFYEWLKKGGQCKNGVYTEFQKAVKNAEAEAEVRDVALIEMAAKENWTAAAWRLERRHPDRWGRKEHHEVTGEGGKAITIKVVYEGDEKTPSA